MRGSSVHMAVARVLVGLVLGVLSLPSALQAQDTDGGPARRNLPNYNVLAMRGRSRQAEALRAQSTAPMAKVQALLQPGRGLTVDDRLGVPTFLKARSAPENLRPSKVSPAFLAASRTPKEAIAREHLNRFASLYGMDSGDVAAATLANVHDTGRGAVIVKLRQAVGGVEVFRDEVNIVLNRNLDLLAISGYIPGRGAAPAVAAGFSLEGRQAVARALGDLTGAPTDGAMLRSVPGKGGYGAFELVPEAVGNPDFTLQIPARAKPVLFHLPEGLQPAYYVEVSATNKHTNQSDYFGYVISATDGSLLFRNNLTAEDVYTYRVWANATSRMPLPGPHDPTLYLPHLTGLNDGAQQAFVAPSLVGVEYGPISTKDPWLAPGATETHGNNVDAYVDLVAPDGLTDPGDFRGSVSAAGQFGYLYDTSLAPNANVNQQQASIAQLFFTTNFLHDWYYDAGFDEAAGNAQTSNFGRGGVEGDNLHAEAQDYSGVNNANMSTPADGGHPRMQMYNWTGLTTSSITVSGGPTYVTGTASFGSTSFNLTGDVIYGTPANGCTTITNGVAGNIVLIDRGTCAFVIKAQQAQAAGAIGLIVANNVSTTIPPGLGGADPSITIPVLSITLSDGNDLKTRLLSGSVTLTMVRTTGVNRDGSLDSQVVAHEWGHYISNRLVANASGLGNNQGRSMGEGWADFHALLLTVRDGVDLNGTFSVGAYDTSNYYYAIRRAPYSTDFTKNGLTFKHITDGVAMPTTTPATQVFSNNAEVHNSGEVWTAMLWECYAALLGDTRGAGARLTFTEAQERMKRYLVAGYKLTPPDPTFLEARDALLTAAFGESQEDGLLFAQAFARRGAGTGAVAPDRYSTNHVGVVESFAVGGLLAFEGVALTEDPTNCNVDGFLTNGERGIISVTLRNTGPISLSATTATLTSDNPHVTFPAGNVITFPPSQPFGSASTGSLPVVLSGAVGVEAVTFSIAYTDPDLLLVGPPLVTGGFRINDASVASSSATDDVESPLTSWTATAAPTTWTRVAVGPQDHRWHGPDLGGVTDLSLVSPALQVSPTQPFTLTFKHRYAFEAAGATYYDGGVIEVSTDGGGSWADLNTYVTAGYGGTLTSAGSTNPLAGRLAFVSTSAGYPAMTTLSLDLGTALAGQTVRIRFRIGSDQGTSAAGWDVDDITLGGITNTPFATVVTGQACQSITFAAIPSHTFGEAPFALSATASSGLPVAFSVVSGPATLVGSQVTLTGAGTVTVRATQAGDATFHAAASVDRTFTVDAPITIGTNPANRTVLEGLSATFTVAATGATTPTYQWKKNGTPLPGATAASYTTPPTSLADTGATYTVVVTNTLGSSTSTSATLTVKRADLNNDGKVNVFDLGALADAIGSTDPSVLAIFDLDGDGQVSDVDALLFLMKL